MTPVVLHPIEEVVDTLVKLLQGKGAGTYGIVVVAIFAANGFPVTLTTCLLYTSPSPRDS